MTQEERDKRRRIANFALRGNKIEGLKNPPELVADLDRWVEGELTVEEVIAHIDHVAAALSSK